MAEQAAPVPVAASGEYGRAPVYGAATGPEQCAAFVRGTREGAGAVAAPVLPPHGAV